MDAVRCLRCGETRWTLFRAAAEPLPGRPCELCGGPTVRERRRPGASRRPPVLERRGAQERTGPARLGESR
jgi:hypothetical protein